MRVLDVLRERAYGKLMGDCYTAGNLLLLAGGTFGARPHEVISAILFLVTGLLFSYRGNDDRWFAAGCALGSLGAIAANWPAVGRFLWTLHPDQPATLIGTLMCVTGAALGALKPFLQDRFGSSRNAVVKLVLGNPRRVMGFSSAASKIFIIVDAMIAREIVYTAVLALWLLGDYFATQSAEMRGFKPLIAGRE